MTVIIQNNNLPIMNFLPPNGKQIPGFINIGGKAAILAQEILDKGYVFEMEILRGREISLTIADKIIEDDVDIEITLIAERHVKIGLDILINRFHEHMISIGARAGGVQ